VLCALESFDSTQPFLPMSMRPFVLIAVLSMGLFAVDRPAHGAVPESVLARPALQKIHPSLRAPGFQANVLIRLDDPPLVARLGKNAKQLGFKLSLRDQVAYAGSCAPNRRISPSWFGREEGMWSGFSRLPRMLFSRS